MDQLLLYLTIGSAYLPDYKVLKETEKAIVIDVNKASPSAGKPSHKTCISVSFWRVRCSSAWAAAVGVMPESVCEDATDS